ncbi:hypothetical protein LXL04_034374 [Taraxacum kok-saghyz]
MLLRISLKSNKWKPIYSSSTSCLGFAAGLRSPPLEVCACPEAPINLIPYASIVFDSTQILFVYFSIHRAQTSYPNDVSFLLMEAGFVKCDA